MTAAIVGARKPSQIEETIKAGEVAIDESLWQVIEELLAERARKITSCIM